MALANFLSGIVEGGIFSSWLTLVLCLSLLVVVLTLLVQRARFVHAFKNIPAPFAMPLIGNAYQLNCTPEEFFKKLTKWGQEFGDIYTLWVGMRPFIFLYRVESVQPLLSSSVNIDKSLEYDYLRPWLGTGLVTSFGEKWHFRRKLLTPTFHTGLLEGYFKTAMRESRILIKCLEKEIGNPGFDIVPYAKRAALDVICDSTMGYHINAQTNCRNEYVLAVDAISNIIQRRFVNVWIANDKIFKMTAMGKEHDHYLKIIHEFVNKVISDRKAEWKSKRDANFNEPMKKRQALLDMMLEMSENGTILSDEDIQEEVNTFMYAGHDTTATSISWILYALGRHPEYQQKILDEYDEVIGSNNDIVLDALGKLVWLEACIKETWRLYPVVPLIARQITTPIKIMGHDIPVGATALINSYLLHRDPRNFPEPEVYRPERFLPNAPKSPNYSFIPFSAGSRNCIGWKFATMTVKVSVLSILRSYQIESLDRQDQLRCASELVLVNAGGLRLKITPRKQ